MNSPSSVEVIYHSPSALPCGPMSPKSIVSEGEMDWLVPSWEPISEKAMSRSFEFCDDLRLRGGDREIEGIAIADVFDQHPQGEGYRRLDLGCKGIITINIVL